MEGWSGLAVLSKKVVLLFLAVLILLSIAVRYPLVEHERFQTDSYTIHNLSDSIVEAGYAKWTFSPFSYVGYYPLSYPSGTPFLLAEFSVATGLSVESSILLCGIMFGVISCLGVFLLARQFVRTPTQILLATFFAVLGARFVDTTYWDGSARGPLVVLAILVVFAAFRAAASEQRMLLFLSGFLALGCFATHHMAVLLVLFALGYVLAAIQVHFLFKRTRTRKRIVAVSWNLATGALIVFVAFSLFSYFGGLALINLRESSVFRIDPPFVSVLLNAALSYSNQIGLILLFFFLGIPSLFRDSRLRVESLYPVTLCLAFIPLIGLSLYVSMLLSPFIAMFGAIWISRSFKKAKRKTIVSLLVVALMAISIATPFASSYRWNSREYPGGDTVEVDSRIFSDGVYMGHNYGGVYAISSDSIMSSELGAAGEARFLGSGISLVLNGDVTREDINERVTWSTADFPVNIYQWFEYNQELNVDYYVQNLMVYGMGYVSGLGPESYFLSSHSNIIVAIDNEKPTQYVGTWTVQHSVFAAQLLASSWQSAPSRAGGQLSLQSYCTYQSGKITLYAVDLNG